MKVGDRVAIRVDQLREIDAHCPWENLCARGTIARIERSYLYVSWDRGHSIASGGWLGDRFILESKIHEEVTLCR